MTPRWSLLSLCLALAACHGKDAAGDNALPATAQVLLPSTVTDTGGARSLAGTAWQLVRFQSMNDWTFTPVDHASYTIAFTPDGRVSIRADCNRGSGSWSSPGPNVLQFGPIASTKAICPPRSHSEQFLRDFEYMTSYMLEGGMLHISLMADGGIYDLEPMETQP